MKKEIIFQLWLVIMLSFLMAACTGNTPTPQAQEPKATENVVTEQPAAEEEESLPTDSTPRKSSLKMATDFMLPDSNGNMVSLADELQENEQVVLVFYYSSACQPCMEQLSEIENDRAKYEEKGAQVIAIAIQVEPDASVSAKGSNAQYPILVGDKAVAEAYDVFESLSPGFDLDFGLSTPSVFIINKDGHIVWSQISQIEGYGCGTERVPSQTILENLG